MSALTQAALAEITRLRPPAEVARDTFEAKSRIDSSRASVADRIKGVWRAHLAGEIDEAEADRQDRQLRDQLPPPPAPMWPMTKPQCSAAEVAIRRRRRPDLVERRQAARKQAFSGPMPPDLACKFSPSELAVLNIVADEVVKNGTCRLKVERIAERAHVSRRTVQNAIKEARLRRLLLVRRRRLTRTLSLPNIVIIVSKEWSQWLKRRGAWMPATRSIDWRALQEASNKGAKRCTPQVSIYKKERGERAKLDNIEAIRRSIFGSDDPTPVNLCAAGPP